MPGARSVYAVRLACLMAGWRSPRTPRRRLRAATRSAAAATGDTHEDINRPDARRQEHDAGGRETAAAGPAVLESERSLAQEYLAAGVLDAAFDHFTATLIFDPHDVPSLDGLARIWRDWGYLQNALPLAYQAVYWAPESAAAHNTLGSVLLRLGVPTPLVRASIRLAGSRRRPPIRSTTCVTWSCSRATCRPLCCCAVRRSHSI